MNCFGLDLLGFGFWAFYGTEMEVDIAGLSPSPSFGFGRGPQTKGQARRKASIGELENWGG